MRSITLTSALVMALVATSAMASSNLVDKGTIKSMDAKACTVTLADKMVFQFPTKCNFSKLTANEKVTITYVVKGKVNTALKIAAA